MSPFSFVEEVAEYNTVNAGIRCTARKTVTNSSAPEQMLRSRNRFNEEKRPMGQNILAIIFVVVLICTIVLIIEYPMLIFIPAVIALIKIIVALLMYKRDRKLSEKYPPLPNQDHKGTWSNPKYFKKEDLEKKE